MISEIDIKDMTPEIEVTAVKENEDGSADCIINMNQAAVRFLLNFAFVSSLKNAINEGKVYTAPSQDQDK